MKLKKSLNVPKSLKAHSFKNAHFWYFSTSKRTTGGYFICTENMFLFKVWGFQSHPQITLVTLINFCFRIKASFLRFFLPIRKPLVAKSSETCALASPKDIVKQGMKISKVWEIHKLLWSKFSVYAPKNSLLNVKLGKIFTSAITNGGYLQWKEYKCYKKICTETRY